MINNIIHILRKFYINQLFNPSFVAIFLNPFFISRRGLSKAIKNNSHFIKGDVIDIGCGSKPYKKFFNFKKYIGVDLKKNNKIHLEEVDIVFDGKKLPFDNERFDSFICSQVFEHVFNLSELLNSINKVLKKNSTGIVTIPFIWDEHEQPIDFARYTSFGIIDILSKNGFEIIKTVKINNNLSCIFQLISLYIYKILPNNKYIHLIFSIFVFSIINFIGFIIKFIFPKNNDMYLDLLIVVKKN